MGGVHLAVNLRDHFISQADIAVIFMKCGVNGKPFLYLFDIVLLTYYLLYGVKRIFALLISVDFA